MKAFLRGVMPHSALRFCREALAAWRCRSFANERAVKRALEASYPPWEPRIAEVCSSPDNAHIPRVAGAGTVEQGLVVMHNGLRVGALSYAGGGALKMLMANGGVHEPQEERAFGEILRFVKPGSSMLELGAFWSFYSLWFMQKVPGAKCYIVEPDTSSLAAGRLNFRLNAREAVFEQAFVGNPQRRSDDGTPFITVDDFCSRHAIDHLGILHADIQYAELEMLDGARMLLQRHGADFVFISSHSDELHYACIDALKEYGYAILASADLAETYSYDGLIVARSPKAEGPDILPISHKPRA
jgi:hypothetical protein